MHDVIVIGGGPAGSTAATLLARQGFRCRCSSSASAFRAFRSASRCFPTTTTSSARLGVYDKLVDGGFFPKYGAEFVTARRLARAPCSASSRTSSRRTSASFQVERSRVRSAAAGALARERRRRSRGDAGRARRSLRPSPRRRRHDGRRDGTRRDSSSTASGHGAFLGACDRPADDGRLAQEEWRSSRTTGTSAPDEGRDGCNIVIVVLRNAWFWMIPLSEEKMSVGLVTDRETCDRCGLSREELLERTIATHAVRRRADAERRADDGGAARGRISRIASRRIVGENFAVRRRRGGLPRSDLLDRRDDRDEVGASRRRRRRRGEARTAASMRAAANVSSEDADGDRPLSPLHRATSTAASSWRCSYSPDPPRPMYHGRSSACSAGMSLSSPFDRAMLGIFFALVRLQKRFGMIAPRIEWERAARRGRIVMKMTDDHGPQDENSKSCSSSG